MSCGIYRINLGNDYFYIGSSNAMRGREVAHRSLLSRGKHFNKRVQHIFDKYKLFDFVILDVCDETDLLQKEQALLDEHFSDLKNVNLLPTAGSNIGWNHSPEAKQKIVNALRLRERKPVTAATRKLMSDSGKKRAPATAEHRANISKALKLRGPDSAEVRATKSEAQKLRWENTSPERRIELGAPHKGKVLSPEQRLKISKTLTGKKRGPHSSIHRQRISEANTGKTHSVETRQKLRERIVSPETRLKLSAAAKEQWARKRAA